MTEYKVVDISKLQPASIETILNKLANDDWVVVCTIGVGAIIMERIVEEGELVDEEVMQRLYTYSLPGMDGKDVGCRD